MAFLYQIIYKAAIDWANELNYSEIVEFLTIVEKTLNKLKESENENHQLKEKTQCQEVKINHQNDEINYLKSLLLSIKEKYKDIEFYNFDEYEDGSIIGEGVTSCVKIVFKKEKYAKKELKDFTFKKLKGFISECDFLFKLRHPCIIKVFGFSYGDDKHSPSMILQLETTSLEKAISNNELSNEQKNRLTVELVLGMRYIHAQKFMHRDLKPSNILLSKNMHVRISDFGLACEENLDVSQSKGIGTLRFMAPELFEENGKKYSNKVDVYSFGIVLIYIVTNNYPNFSLKNVCNGILPNLPNTIVKWVQDLIFRCLSFEHEKRPAFAEIFEIMKMNNYDLFTDKKNKLTLEQKNMMKTIEARILKIEAFEYQHEKSSKI